MKTTACRSCKAPVIWARTKGGKYIPLDAKPDAKGNVAVVERTDHDGCVAYDAVMRKVGTTQPTLGFEPLYMPHHATCPQGREWRR